MNGYIIYESLISSRRWNKLLQHPIGEFSQLLYVLSYIKADFWGHLPFDCEWLKLQVFPGNGRDYTDIRTAMTLLLLTRLWDNPYLVGDNLYTHIFGFEHWSKGAIRRRAKGQWPDESGSTPRRDNKTPIEDDILLSQQIRDAATSYISIDVIPEFTGIYRNILENYPCFSGITGNFQQLPVNSLSTVQYSTVQYLNTETAKAGFLDSFPQVIHISGKEIRKTYLASLLRKLGNDYHQLCLILYRASKANDPYAYIEKGLTEKYIYEPSKDEYETPQYVQAWIDTLCGITTPLQPQKNKSRTEDPESIATLVSNLIPKEDLNGSTY